MPSTPPGTRGGNRSIHLISYPRDRAQSIVRVKVSRTSFVNLDESSKTRKPSVTNRQETRHQREQTSSSTCFWMQSSHSTAPAKYRIKKHKPRDLKFTCKISKTENEGSQITCQISNPKTENKGSQIYLPNIESKNINQGISNLPAKMLNLGSVQNFELEVQRLNLKFKNRTWSSKIELEVQTLNLAEFQILNLGEILNEFIIIYLSNTKNINQGISNLHAKYPKTRNPN